VPSDSTLGLAHVLASRRAIGRQCLALAALLAGCLVWRLSPLGEPEPYVGLVLLVGGAILAVDLGLDRLERDRETRHADALIVAGFICEAARTPVEQAIRRRLEWVERPRSRHRLARALRWRLRIADGTVTPSPGYVRAAVLPPLVAYERQALLAEHAAVWAMADRVDRGPADPRALVLLWSVISTPPSLGAAEGRDAGRELRRRLHAAQALLEGAPGRSQETMAAGSGPGAGGSGAESLDDRPASARSRRW
jgi:hypothetical protein